MKFHDEKKLKNLETDASEVGLEAGLLLTREGISYLRDETPNNSILGEITSKSLLSTEKDTVT